MSLSDPLSAGEVIPDLEKGKELFSANGFKRLEKKSEEYFSHLIDSHREKTVKVIFLRVNLWNFKIKIPLQTSTTSSEIIPGQDYGNLIRATKAGKQLTIWFPLVCGLFSFDACGRIAAANGNASLRLEAGANIKLDLLVSGKAGETAIIPYVLMDDPEGRYFEEISSLNDTERRLYLKSDWFFGRRPLDLWNYLINGSIYDPRQEEGVHKRFKCQQCALAWWNYFGFLRKETNKEVYDVFQDEIAYGVLLDLSAEGEWGHGYWFDSPETHTRFHLDGIHLLLSQYSKTHDLLWLKAAERGMAFFSKNLSETLDDGGMWYLHDTREKEQKHRFQSRLFGKSPGNSLCLNTHVQALTVLRRLRGLREEEPWYSKMFERGISSLHRALDQQPATAIYALLTRLMMLYKKRMPGEFQKPLPGGSLGKKIKNRLWRYIPQLFWLVRRFFPRVVYPGGFTERDLTLSFFSDRYHVINMKDFLTLYQQNPTAWLKAYIKNGFSFIRRYLKEIDLKVALSFSPYYIELIDVFFMYHRLIEPVPQEELKAVQEVIYSQSGGYSLDYFASELVNGERRRK